ncbi:hypothetical protein [Chitinophaga sp. Cy-1792]|uniref:hypothetical protein n=1 Tax=Chitinophaga sp. Cy-1792 TaxID=2608339 RepID=UPI001420DF05|nr:hypothetical protein [Chitinophaga sp. Cy-1792]NIG55098.1 hypothetical protein [Chitinophaga sp. Cy-1792]
MYTVYHRVITDEEAALLAQRTPVPQNNLPKLLSSLLIILMAVFISAVTNRRISDANGEWPLPLWLVMLGPAVCIAGIILLKRLIRRNNEMNEIMTALVQVEVAHIVTHRALVREDEECCGEGFYLDVWVEGKQQTLYLQNQQFDMLAAEKKFPNTEIEIVQTLDKRWIGATMLGKYLAPERVLPAFERADMMAGNCPRNGDLLDMTIAEVTA